MTTDKTEVLVGFMEAYTAALPVIMALQRTAKENHTTLEVVLRVVDEEIERIAKDYRIPAWRDENGMETERRKNHGRQEA